jgi:hypothetical protein
MTLPFSSGYVRGGANASPDWGVKFGDHGSQVHTIAGKTTKDLPVPKPTPDITPTLLESEKPSSHTMTKAEARLSGYTGDQCDNCFSMQMKISGHCKVCESCGTTTGCS